LKPQFIIDKAAVLANGNILASGKTIGPPLTPGKRGHALTQSGEVTVEVISIGIIDLKHPKLPQQALQCKLISGKQKTLNGATLDFD
jgi:hypothetical protein